MPTRVSRKTIILEDTHGRLHLLDGATAPCPELLASVVVAVACDFHFFAACRFAIVAAVFLVGWDRTLTRLVCALTRFLLFHDV